MGLTGKIKLREAITMFSVIKNHEREEIENLIARHAANHGITSAQLDTPVGEQYTCRALVYDLVLETMQSLDAANQKEICRRRREGIARAQQAGIAVGRPTKRPERRFRKIRAQYEAHEITAEQASSELDVSISTFYRWLRSARDADEK